MSPVDDETRAFSLRTFKIADCTLLTDRIAAATHQEDEWSRLDRHEIDLVLGWYDNSVVNGCTYHRTQTLCFDICIRLDETEIRQCRIS